MTDRQRNNDPRTNPPNDAGSPGGDDIGEGGTTGGGGTLDEEDIGSGTTGGGGSIPDEDGDTAEEDAPGDGAPGSQTR